MKKIYLDNGSTSFPKAPGVAEAMKSFLEQNGYNINRGGYEESYKVSDIVLETRSMMAEMFHLGERKEKNVIFVPSVTYGLNFVILGLLKPGDNVIITSMEHNAVARACESLKNKGVDVTVAECERDGMLNFESFESSFKENTKLVVACHASNVSGTIQDAEKIGEIAKKNGAFFLLDGAQSAGTVDIDFEKFHLSALCVPGHKGLLGPQGIGAMILSDEIACAIEPLVLGGTGSISDSLMMPDFLPDKFEPGTINLPGIIGLNSSLKYIRKEGNDKILSHERKLAQKFVEELHLMDPRGEKIRIIGNNDFTKRVGVVSLDFLSMDNGDVAFRLESQYGIMTRCGMHCAPLAHKTLGTYPEGTVRFSFGYFNTDDEVKAASDAIKEIIA